MLGRNLHHRVAFRRARGTASARPAGAARVGRAHDARAPQLGEREPGVQR